MTTDTGGPAFPAERNLTQGMTLRDYFAAKAMQAIIEKVGDWKYLQQPVADWAYEYADAMLKARTK
jgi:hypothetical protein